jgi:hypothetical protein
MAKRASKKKVKEVADYVSVGELAEEGFHEELTKKELERQEEQQEFEAAVEKLDEAGALDSDEEPSEKNSIVKPKFKHKYIENAKAIGAVGKAAKRSNWDWLSQQLATYCLNDKGKIDIGAFTDVLDANGVDHSRWTNRNKGWEGRFRMTGRVALQKTVANAGVMKWPNGLEDVAVPEDFQLRYKTKA